MLIQYISLFNHSSIYCTLGEMVDLYVKNTVFTYVLVDMTLIVTFEVRLMSMQR